MTFALAMLTEPADEPWRRHSPSSRYEAFCNWLDQLAPEESDLVVIIGRSRASLLGQPNLGDHSERGYDLSIRPLPNDHHVTFAVPVANRGHDNGSVEWKGGTLKIFLHHTEPIDGTKFRHPILRRMPTEAWFDDRMAYPASVTRSSLPADPALLVGPHLLCP